MFQYIITIELVAFAGTSMDLSSTCSSLHSRTFRLIEIAGVVICSKTDWNSLSIWADLCSKDHILNLIQTLFFLYR